MFRTVLVLASGLAGLAVVPAFADAQGPAYNQGSDGWWPGGYGYPPVTVQAWNYPACSVTAYGPTFVSGLARQNYGAGTSCAGGIGTKSLAVSDRVLGQDGRTWFTITGSTVSERPVSYNPVHAILNRVAVLGHEYRTIATAGLVVPTCYGGSESVAITAGAWRHDPVGAGVIATGATVPEGRGPRARGRKTVSRDLRRVVVSITATPHPVLDL